MRRDLFMEGFIDGKRISTLKCLQSSRTVMGAKENLFRIISSLREFIIKLFAF